MTNLKRFFFGLSALIILSFFGFKYWQTLPSYSLLQIQKSIETKDSDLFYKHVDVENIIEEFFKDSFKTYEQNFSDIFGSTETSEFFNPEIMAESAFSYIKPEIVSSIEQGLDNIWNESQNDTSSEFISEEDIEIANEMLESAELAYLNKDGDKAYLGISLFDSRSEQEIITEFELTKVKNYWQVTKWSNFEELVNEVIDDLIESFNNIGEDLQDDLFDTKELEQELEDLEKELEDLLKLYDE